MTKAYSIYLCSKRFRKIVIVANLLCSYNSYSGLKQQQAILLFPSKLG
jgi:hypothetical protein